MRQSWKSAATKRPRRRRNGLQPRLRRAAHGARRLRSRPAAPFVDLPTRRGVTWRMPRLKAEVTFAKIVGRLRAAVLQRRRSSSARHADLSVTPGEVRRRPVRPTASSLRVQGAVLNGGAVQASHSTRRNRRARNYRSPSGGCACWPQLRAQRIAQCSTAKVGYAAGAVATTGELAAVGGDVRGARDHRHVPRSHLARD